MKQIFNCDYCSYCDSDEIKMRTHEKTCAYNPTNKKCYTCTYRNEVGYGERGSILNCELKLNTTNIMDNGNCKKWKLEND